MDGGDSRDWLKQSQQLTRIADALEALVSLQAQMLALELQPPPMEPLPAPASTCPPHPADQVVSLGAGDWECRACRTQFQSPPP